MRSVGGGMLLVTSFVSAIGSKLGLNKGCIGRTVVGLSVWETYVEALGK